MLNKEVLNLKLVTRSQMEEMAQMLAFQSRRLRELEVKLQKETLEKANLEADFQHLLDQINARTHTDSMCENPAMVCG